jgi:GNAT superfamily N-acetyltransferase
MVAMKIGVAEIKDAERIADLATQLGYPSNADEVVTRLKSLPDDGAHAVFVAEDKVGRVVGWVHVYKHPTLLHESVAEIGGLVVDTSARGSGIGRKLMQRAEDWARQRGLGRVVLRSNILRNEAHTFYERLGYSRMKTQHVFLKKL